MRFHSLSIKNHNEYINFRSKINFAYTVSHKSSMCDFKACLSKIILNTSISGVKSSWTTLFSCKSVMRPVCSPSSSDPGIFITCVYQKLWRDEGFAMCQPPRIFPDRGTLCFMYQKTCSSTLDHQWDNITPLPEGHWKTCSSRAKNYVARGPVSRVSISHPITHLLPQGCEIDNTDIHRNTTVLLFYHKKCAALRLQSNISPPVCNFVWYLCMYFRSLPRLELQQWRYSNWKILLRCPVHHTVFS